MSSGLWILTGRGDTGHVSSSPVDLVLWATANCLAFAGVYVEREKAGKLLRNSWPLVALLALAVVSSLWSSQHLITARPSIEFLGTGAFATYFVCRLGLRAFVETLAAAIAVTGILSLLLVILFPGFGIQADFDGAWSGLFSHKNRLGPVMVLGLISVACLTQRSTRIFKVLQVALCVMFCVLLIGSKNGGGVGAAIILAGIIGLLLWSRSTHSKTPVLVSLLVLSVVVVVGMIVGLGADDAFGVIGKDSTLTGRVELWQLVIEAIRQQPLLGYGYSAFWGGDGPADTLIYSSINWVPGTAHNGFLEVALNLGLVGEAVLFALIVIGIRRSWLVFWSGTDVLSAWPLFVMLYMIFTNVSDATFIEYNLTDTMVFMAAFLFAEESLEPIHSDTPAKKARSDVANRINIHRRPVVYGR